MINLQYLGFNLFVTEQGDQASEPHTVSFGLMVCVCVGGEGVGEAVNQQPLQCG